MTKRSILVIQVAPLKEKLQVGLGVGLGVDLRVDFGYGANWDEAH